jgi:YbbR domain-containing protein
VSLIAALALWVAVTDAENPRETRDFGAAIPVEAVNVADGLAVRNITPSGVRIRVSATDDDFAKLTTANFAVEVDMTGVRDPTSNQIVVARVLGLDNVDIIDVSPDFVDVTLEQETSKTVPVRVNRVGTLPQGFSVSAEQANPQEVRVTGASSLVQLVESAVADVNLTGVRSNIQKDFPLVPRDASGADQRVKVQPDTAQVRLTIVQQDTSLLLPVQVQTQGTLPDGYNIVAAAAEPQLVQVSGTIEVLQGVTSLSTEPIDISGQRNDITRSVSLRVPSGMQATRTSVNVTIRIRPTPGEKAVIVAPQVTDVPDGLQATLQTTSVTVRLAGDLPTLNGISAGQVRATVSVAGLGEGVHVLTAQISAPAGASVAGVEPPQVVVVLHK